MGMPKVWVFKDTTFFAKYKVNNWTVTFDANGGTGAMSPVSQDEGIFMLPANKFTPPEHYHFVGWSYESDGEIIPASFINLTSDVTLYAIYSIDTFKVSFWANGGIGTKDPIMVPYGEYTLPPVPFNNPGKKNVGWAYTPTGKYIETDTILVDEEKNLYAVYQSIYISFDSNGGSGTMSPVELQSKDFLLPECKFTPPSSAQEFIGWSYSSEGPIITTSSIQPTEDTTLYAIWGSVFTVTLTIEDNTGRVKTEILRYSSGYKYTLPLKSPFISTLTAVWKWWSYTPNGEAITEKTITISEDTVIYGVCDCIIILDPNGSSSAQQKFQVSKNELFTLPETCPFTPPFGKTFKGWSYTSKGNIIKDKQITVSFGMIIYAIWGSGFSNWIQLVDFDNPKEVTSLGQVYSEMSHTTPYIINEHYAFWNNVELFAYEVTDPIVEVNELPEFGPSNSIYHLTTNDTYWHYEYDVIARLGGLIERSDDLYWEEITLINLNTPRISDNTQEVYYKNNVNHCFYYDYIKKAWYVQNEEVYGLIPDYTVDYNDMYLVPKRENRVKEIYKITTTIGDETYYCWCRLVDGEYHHPARPRIDEICYWIIDNDWHLWAGNRPLVAKDIQYSGQFYTKTTYATHQGPWRKYAYDIKYTTILDDISPVELSHWFDDFITCKGYEGLEHLKSDYCTQVTALFAMQAQCEKFEGIENFNTENVKDFDTLFASDIPTIMKEIDLSGWNTKSGIRFFRMFARNPNLEHIYVGDNWYVGRTTIHDMMFGEGTRKIHNFNGNESGTYAIIDNGTNGGYLERKCIISFNANGGAGEMKNKYAKKNTTFTIPTNEFGSSFGKAFLGWSLSPDGEFLGETIEVKDKDITLYAIWG